MKFLSLLPILFFAACSPSSSQNPPSVTATLPESLIPPKGALFGAYIDFGDTEDTVSLKKIERFEQLIGKAPAIIASSSYWGEKTFPKANVNLIAAHGAIPLIFWSPWDKPYDQDKGPDRFSLTEILSGCWDSYIDMWARSAKEFKHPFFVSFCNEMNGSWFPWSGYFYGKGGAVKNQPGKFEGPETFKTAWRYVVDRVRAQGATNIRWVMQFNNYSYPAEKWNQMAHYYPGSKYVDWIGLSVYGKQFPWENGWANVEDLLDFPYQEACKVDPTKPLMVAEFGVGEFPKDGDKAKWIMEMFSRMESQCPRIHAAIYWHERWQNADNSYSNLHVDSSMPSLAAFRRALTKPYWLGRMVAKSTPLTKKRKAPGSE